MSDRMFRILFAIFIVIAFLFVINEKGNTEGIYDDDFQGTEMYVIATNLNLRASPRKKSLVMTMAENGDVLTATGKWSKDYRWIQIYHPEEGYLWCDYHFVTERQDSFLVETLWDTPIKIRSQAVNGRVTGYLRKGKTIEITQVVFGWGRCKAGWIDLEYCIEIGE